nr:hypothetical protein [Treponema sp. OMZ 803]
MERIQNTRTDNNIFATYLRDKQDTAVVGRRRGKIRKSSCRRR